jgi:hypothetical protein
VLLPADRSRPRPTLYMLDGRGASENASSWIEHGHAVEFFADKNVNVVLTTGGPANLYTAGSATTLSWTGESLRGTRIYFSGGSGIPGEHDYPVKSGTSAWTAP